MADPRPAEPPSRLGSYEIVRRLGCSSTSEVLLARAPGPFGFARSVVIKKVLASRVTDDDAAQALVGEALAYSRLTHDAIVKLYEFTPIDGYPALVLEYVDGVSLQRLVEELAATGTELESSAALYIGFRVFSALAAAHAAREPSTGAPAPVIHRDVCPRHVLLAWDGHVKLSSFALAKVVGATMDTNAGLMKGTIGYMAPEQALGDEVTTATDVYLGSLLLRELLAGAPTFGNRMPELALLQAMADASFPPLEDVRPGLAPGLYDALRRGLARAPGQRSLTALEMMDVLKRELILERGRMALADTLARLRKHLVPVGEPGGGQGDAASPTTTARDGAAPRPPGPLHGRPPESERSGISIVHAPATFAPAQATRRSPDAPYSEREPPPDVSFEMVPLESGDLPTDLPTPPAAGFAQTSASYDPPSSSGFHAADPVTPPIALPPPPPLDPRENESPPPTPRVPRVPGYAQLHDPVTGVAGVPRPLGLVGARHLRVRLSAIAPIVTLGAFAALALVATLLTGGTAVRSTAVPVWSSRPAAEPVAVPAAETPPVPAVTATAAPAVTAPPVTSGAAPAPDPAPAPAMAPGHGLLTLGPSAREHRVYVDGVLVGEGEGPFDVRCGSRSVRVGSRGEPRTIDVPCAR